MAIQNTSSAYNLDLRLSEKETKNESIFSVTFARLGAC